MLKTCFAAVFAAVVASSAYAEPLPLRDADEGYTRLSRWEQHLDDVIAQRVNRYSIDPRLAWRVQKQLDSIEAHVLQSYYESDEGIDFKTFRRYASQLRDISKQLGEFDWGSQNVYGDGWFDDRQPEWNDRNNNGNGQNSNWNGQNNGYGPDNRGSYNYYRQGDYEGQCRNNNKQVAGTVFGALAGGLIGNAASRGNGGATVGGVILGGLLGNVLTRDLDCNDHRYAFDAYNQSLNGDMNRDYEWRRGDHYGSFRAVRDYRTGDWYCREFQVVTFRDGQRIERQGSACRDQSGMWQTR